ncbi:MAG: gamma-glutamyltransferase, partial [Paracoccaceae bacterium]|nr:gamma-glutamyltransferase [Paracoccaceae bacterium]
MASKIDPTAASNHDIGTNENAHKDTVYLTVVDENRCMVSLIFSIFNSFGSGYASEKFGLLFHNRGAGFSLEKGHPNELDGGKRPLHTIIPAFLKKKNEFIMPFGVMGGQYQANGHARLISNIIDYGMDIQSAIDFPRSFPEAGHLKLENGYSNSIAVELEKKGHEILRPSQPIGGAQAIICDNITGTLIGGSDPRKDGCALGY